MQLGRIDGKNQTSHGRLRNDQIAANRQVTSALAEQQVRFRSEQKLSLVHVEQPVLPGRPPLVYRQAGPISRMHLTHLAIRAFCADGGGAAATPRREPWDWN